MSEKKQISGIDLFVTLLTISFIVLKLIGEISWPWWWVLSPLWVTVSIATVLIVLVALSNKNN